MKTRRLLQRRSLGGLVAVCLLLAIAGSVISAAAADASMLKLVIENETNPEDLNCGTVVLETNDINRDVYEEAEAGGEVFYGQVDSGAEVSITAIAHEGYEFAGWQVRGAEEAEYSEHAVTFVMPDSEVEVYVIFQKAEGTPDEDETPTPGNPDDDDAPSTPDDSGGSGNGGGSSVSYQLEYSKMLTLSVNSKYPEKNLSVSLAELSELLGVKLMNGGSEIPCEIASSSDYSAELFDETGTYTVHFQVIHNGQSYAGSVELTIADTTPPVIVNLSENLYLELENESVAAKTWDDLIMLFDLNAVDNYDGKVVVFCEFEDTSFEEIDWTKEASYLIVAYAEDESGNGVEKYAILYVSTAPQPDTGTSGGGNNGGTGGGGTTGGSDSWPDEVWEKIPEDVTLVPKDDGSWEVQNPPGVAIGIVREDDGEWAFISNDETPTGSFTTLPETGSMTTTLIMLFGLALLAAGKLLRKTS